MGGKEACFMSGTLTDLGQLYLWPLCWEAWQAAHDLRQPARDFSDYPVPASSPEAELRWWHEQVDTGQVLVAGFFARRDDHLVGTLKAFDFNPERSRCEIGIEILSPDDYGQGLGYQGMLLWLGFLQAQDVLQVYGLIHPDNQRSRRLFARLGFEETGLEADPQEPEWPFVRVEKRLST
jgi:RimJ/RimL family protein N-acetyltransferase